MRDRIVTGDLQPLSGWQTGGGVPLYMRGANATGDDQDEDQEKDQEQEDDQEELEESG